MTQQATVSTYRLIASNGRPIRLATQVVYSDGTVVRFTERMSKREALRQAEAHLQSGLVCLTGSAATASGAK